MSKTKAENRFPFAKFAPNRLWLHIVALADTLVRWFQKLSLPKHHPLTRAKPKKLRPNLWHIPGVIARHSRQTTLRIPATWPTATRGGHGLSLLVKPTNIGGRLSKTWSQRIRVSGKETNLGLGSFPAVTLAEARRRAVHNSQEIEEGRHPRARSIPTFQQAADTVIEIHSAKWRPNSKTRQGWVSSLETYVFPTIGDKGVDEITSADVMACLSPIWFTKADTARRLRQRVATVMRWAIAEGHRRDDPTGAITAALGKNTGRRGHYRSVPYSEVAEALATIGATKAWKRTVWCFEFLTLCAVRSGEARLATWDEINLDSATWTIPAQRTKTGEPHRVPLSTGALGVLSKARELSDGTGLVFPSVTGRAMSDATMSKLCREASIGGTPHGMRSSFRSWAAEMGADWSVAELCLGHRAGSDVELAYQRSDLLERRRDLMQQWAEYLAP